MSHEKPLGHATAALENRPPLGVPARSDLARPKPVAMIQMLLESRPIDFDRLATVANSSFRWFGARPEFVAVIQVTLDRSLIDLDRLPIVAKDNIFRWRRWRRWSLIGLGPHE
jgi:hypothetical protein